MPAPAAGHARGVRGFLLLVATGGAVATIGPGDLTVARVRLDDSLYQAAVPVSEQSQLVSRQLAEPVHANQLLVRA